MANANDVTYTEVEWTAAAGHAPLAGLGSAELALLHRHWMWANQMREAFDQELQREPNLPSTQGMLATRQFGFMFVWYALLWAVIEGVVERKLDLRARLEQDIAALSDTLRRFRNAVFCVPSGDEYLDERLVQLVQRPDSALMIRRIHAALGRLFLDEFRRRRPQSASS